MSKNVFRWVQLLLILVLAACLVTVMLARRNGVEGWNRYRPMATVQDAVDQRTSSLFLAADVPATSRYDTLFFYFLHGLLTNASPGFARINYPGFPSRHGFTVSGLEGFARTTPLLGAWLHSGRSPKPMDPQTGKPVDLVRILHDGILNGTNPASPEYWGAMGPNDQRIVEAADIAVTLWLARVQVWEAFSADQQRQVARWLGQASDVTLTYDNNWNLFPVTVNAFLKAVGYLPTADYAPYYAFKRHYLGNGWYFDKPHGVDFYNAWGITYSLFWIHQMDPALDSDFISSSLADSGQLTAHLISPAGIPIMGRSVCYRAAVPVPVIAASYQLASGVSAGLASRALDVTWRYFVARGILLDGTISQGYFTSDPRFLDLYTGPGSCHWSLRSLTLAYLSPPAAPLWTAAPEPLPVEVADFRLRLQRLGWLVTGRRASQEITIEIGQNTAETLPVVPYSVADRFYEFLSHAPHRDENFAVKYGLQTYSARQPFTADMPQRLVPAVK